MKINNKETIKTIFRDIGIEITDDILDDIFNKTRKN